MSNSDLISRDAAIDALTDTNLRKNVDSVCDGDMNRTRRAAQRVIAQLPAADATPVVHGRWEEKMEHMGLVCCSVCNDCYVEKEWIFNKKWAWCPQCGAKMDGGETNG